MGCVLEELGPASGTAGVGTLDGVQEWLAVLSWYLDGGCSRVGWLVWGRILQLREGWKHWGNFPAEDPCLQRLEGQALSGAKGQCGKWTEWRGGASGFDS